MSSATRQVAGELNQIFPPPAPRAVPGCGDCARYAVLIKSTTHGRDLSTATDLRVLMRRHLQEAH